MSDTRATGVMDFGVLSANGNSTAFELPQVCTTFACQTVPGGTVTALTIKLQGSLDGATWYDLTSSTATAGETLFATGKPSKFVRVALSGLTGTGPSIHPYAAFGQS